MGLGSLRSDPRSIQAQGPCRGGNVPRTNDRRPRCQEAQLRTTLSSAFQDFNGKSNNSMRAIPKQPPEGDVNGIGPMWRYDTKLVQRKHVSSALNAPVSTLITLMRKDAWAV